MTGGGRAEREAEQRDADVPLSNEVAISFDLGEARNLPRVEATPTFTTSNTSLMVAVPGKGCGMLGIADAERLQGLPVGWVGAQELRRSVAWRLIGNAVTVDVAGWLGEALLRPYKYKYDPTRDRPLLPAQRAFLTFDDLDKPPPAGGAAGAAGRPAPPRCWPAAAWFLRGQGRYVAHASDAPRPRPYVPLSQFVESLGDRPEPGRLNTYLHRLAAHSPRARAMGQVVRSLNSAGAGIHPVVAAQVVAGQEGAAPAGAAPAGAAPEGTDPPAAAPPAAPRPAPPNRVLVVCNSVRGYFSEATSDIVCACGDCLLQPNDTARLFSGLRWERHVGAAQMKGWKKSVRVELVDGTRVPVGPWAEWEGPGRPAAVTDEAQLHDVPAGAAPPPCPPPAPGAADAAADAAGDAAGDAAADAAGESGPRVAVRCLGTPGWLVEAQMTVVCACGGCASLPEPDRAMSGPDFERHAGASAQRGWRKSVRVVTRGTRGGLTHGTRGGATVKVQQWLDTPVELRPVAFTDAGGATHPDAGEAPPPGRKRKGEDPAGGGGPAKRREGGTGAEAAAPGGGGEGDGPDPLLPRPTGGGARAPVPVPFPAGQREPPELCLRCQSCLSRTARKCYRARAFASAASGSEGARLALWGERAVGAEVEVFWEKDHAYYPGRVVRFDPFKMTHLVVYDVDEDADDEDAEDLRLWEPGRVVRVLAGPADWAAGAGRLSGSRFVRACQLASGPGAGDAAPAPVLDAEEPDEDLRLVLPQRRRPGRQAEIVAAPFDEAAPAAPQLCLCCATCKERSNAKCLRRRCWEAARGAHEGARLALLGPACLGAEIQVLWPSDNKFYRAHVARFDPFEHRHLVVYADGDVHDLQLFHGQNTVQLRSDPSEWPAALAALSATPYARRLLGLRP